MAPAGAYNCDVSEDSLTAQEAEFETILARLRDEVDRGEGDLGGEQGVDRYERRRREAEQLWAVSAERPFLESTRARSGACAGSRSRRSRASCAS